MNLVTLPPKRWEDSDDPKYDSIRFYPWFKRLQKRKHHIPMLQQAYNQWLQIGKITTQEAICEIWGVSTREFRDYCAFKTSSPGELSSHNLTALNLAYRMYCASPSTPWRNHLTKAADQCGLNPRGLIELWETRPAFYPNGYQS